MLGTAWHSDPDRLIQFHLDRLSYYREPKWLVFGTIAFHMTETYTEPQRYNRLIRICFVTGHAVEFVGLTRAPKAKAYLLALIESGCHETAEKAAKLVTKASLGKAND